MEENKSLTVEDILVGVINSQVTQITQLQQGIRTLQERNAELTDLVASAKAVKVSE